MRLLQSDHVGVSLVTAFIVQQQTGGGCGGGGGETISREKQHEIKFR